MSRAAEPVLFGLARPLLLLELVSNTKQKETQLNLRRTVEELVEELDRTSPPPARPPSDHGGPGRRACTVAEASRFASAVSPVVEAGGGRLTGDQLRTILEQDGSAASTVTREQKDRFVREFGEDSWNRQVSRVREVRTVDGARKVVIDLRQGAPDDAPGSTRTRSGVRSVAGVAGLALLMPEALGAQAKEAPEEVDIQPLLPQDGLLQPETWFGLGDRLLNNAVDYVPRLVASLIVLAVFWALSRFVRSLVGTVMKRTKADPALDGILSQLAFYATFGLGVIMAVAQAGIAIGPLLASVSVLGLAAGLAAQSSLANLMAGLTILWDGPFRLGERVTIGDVYGEVTDISIRTTTVRTPAHRDLVLPNREVIDDPIINHSRTDRLRLDVPVGIGYGEDIDAARDALLAAADQSQFVDPEQGTQVVVTSLGDSSVDLELRAWARDPSEERPATFDLVERCKKALDSAEIEIPFPQRVLHLEPITDQIRLRGGAASQPTLGQTHVA